MAVQCGLSWLALTTVVLLSLWTSLSEAQPDPCPCEVDFRSNDRCTCKVWGDPHITMCNQGQVTCASPGFQVYLATPYILITGVNTAIWLPWSQATWLTEATIEFRSLTEPYHLTYRYKAVGGNIPSTFLDNFGGTANDVVTLTTTAYEAQLTWPYIGLVIKLRKPWFTAPFYGLTVRAACNALNNGIGILVHGCPRCEQIDIGIVWGRRKRAADAKTAQEVCLQHKVSGEGILMKTCMYDVVTTGDPEIAVATANAIDDEKIVVDADAELIAAVGIGCPDGQFTCLDGSCIDMPLRCNGKPDCRDGSDEQGCGCPDGQFTCLDGSCIDMALRCNGRPDCRDGSDEEGCGGEEMRA